MKFRFSLFSALVAVCFACVLVSHTITSVELYKLKNQNPDYIFEIIENGPNNGGGGSDIAILIAAQTPDIAFDEARKHGFTAPWTIYEVGRCLGETDGWPQHLRGPYLVHAAVNSRAWKSYYVELGDPPVFRPDIYPEE